LEMHSRETRLQSREFLQRCGPLSSTGTVRCCGGLVAADRVLSFGHYDRPSCTSRGLFLKKNTRHWVDIACYYFLGCMRSTHKADKRLRPRWATDAAAAAAMVSSSTSSRFMPLPQICFVSSENLCDEIHALEYLAFMDRSCESCAVRQR